MISTANWREKWENIKVHADTPPALIIASNTPALSALGSNATGGYLGETILKLLLKELVEFYNVGWNIEQVKKCANLMYENYHWLTLAELKQFLERVMMGHYESNKNLTPPELLQMAGKYAAEMLGNRYRHFSELRDKKPFFLNIEKIKGNKGKAVACWLCKQEAERREHNMKRLTTIAETIQAFSAKANAEDRLLELRNKNIEKLQRHRQMRDVIEIAMIGGYAPDQTVYKKYLLTLTKINEIENYKANLS